MNESGFFEPDGPPRLSLAVPASNSRIALSARQHLLWAQSRGAASLGDQVISLLVVEHTLAAERMLRAWQSLVDETELLGTRLHQEGELAWLVSSPKTRTAPFLTIDLRHHTLSSPHATALEWAQQRSQQPLVPTERLCEAALLLLPEGHSAVYLALHHLITDASSQHRLLERLGELYAQDPSKTGPCPREARSFSQFVQAERNYLDSASARVAARYFRDFNQGFPDLPYLYGRPMHSRDSKATRHTWILSEGQTLQWKGLATETGGLLGADSGLEILLTSVLTAWALRCGPNQQVPIASTHHNRLPEDQGGVGLYAQLLGLGMVPPQASTFQDLVEGLTQSLVAARTHHRYVAPTPWPGTPWPLLLNLLPLKSCYFGAFKAHHTWVFNGHSNSPVQLHVYDFHGAERLELALDIRLDLLPAPRVAVAAQHLQLLMERMLHAPTESIAAKELWTPAEQAQWVPCNDTVVHEADSTLDALVGSCVKGHPKAIAVRAGDQELTYERFGCEVERMLRGLQAIGIGQGGRVALRLPRNSRLLIAMHAVMACGAAYVPLDEALPDERATFIVRDCGAGLLLVGESAPQPSWQDTLKVSTPETLLQLGAATASPEQASSLPGATPDCIAYITYTSGSTGQPKGVLTSQRALVNFLRSVQSSGFAQAGDVVPACASVSFDMHIMEMHYPLSVGATVVMLPRITASSGTELAQALEEMQATAMVATPATWSLLLGTSWQGCPGLKAHCGGEAMDRELAHQLVDKTQTLHNVYGPTETTVYASFQAVNKALLARYEERNTMSASLPVGPPMANTRFYILDLHGNRVPWGTPGELWIAGLGVAEGYLNRPEDTAARFIEGSSLAHLHEAGRLHRSGDRARWNEEGSIEILGRVDRQLKLRGYRIDPGDIEAALRTVPKIEQALVDLLPLSGQDLQLTAWIIVTPPPPSLEATLHHLRQLLPAYMIPGDVRVVKAYPLNVHGKVDRPALAQGPFTRLANTNPEQASLGGEAPDFWELQLVRLFEEVLGQVGLTRHTHFFDHGGNSFLAIRLMRLMEQRLGASLNEVATLYNHATVAELATLLRQGKQPKVPCLVPLTPGSEPTPLFFVHGLIGDICRTLHPLLGATQPFYALQPSGLDGSRPLLTRVQDMATAYLAEVRQLQAHGPYLLGGYSFGGHVAHEMARLLEQDGETVGLLMLLDTAATGTGSLGAGKGLRSVLDLPLQALDGATRAWARGGSRTLLAWLGHTGGRLLATRTWPGKSKPRWGEKSDQGSQEEDPATAWIVEQFVRQQSGLELWPSNYQAAARAHYHALLEHRALPCTAPTLLIRSATRRSRWARESTTLGWEGLVGNLHLEQVPCQHEQLLQSPFVEQTAFHLQRYLDKVRVGKRARGG